jgi:type I restriction enzyme S subunit
MEVPFTAVAEQQKIVDAIELKFSIADEAEKVINWCIKQSNRLRQSITEKAFEGKLVPQDPSDEPAELLLERIKSKREKQAVESKKVKSQKCS